MSVSRATARDEVLSVVAVALDAAGLDAERVLWEGVQAQRSPSSDSTTLPWAYVRLRHQANAGGERTSLPGGDGLSRFQRMGTVTIELYAAGGDGGKQWTVYAGTLQGSLETVTDSGVEMYDVVATEVGDDGPWFSGVVTVMFKYRQEQ